MAQTLDMVKIVAIGGGELKDLETLAIDRHIVDMANVGRPRALFLPTASADSERYIETFNAVYGRKLGCRTSVLRLLKDTPTFHKAKEQILSADLIHVGGGDTLRMMRAWRRLRVGDLLEQAARKGTVLSGISAGAVSWFKYGHSDSRRFSGKSRWDYMRVSGLGFINGLFCPHYHVERRERSLSDMVARYGGVAFAFDNNAALQIDGRHYRVLVSRKDAKAYRLFKKNKRVVRESLPLDHSYKPLESLSGSST
jgi:dipeptidase E